MQRMFCKTGSSDLGSSLDSSSNTQIHFCTAMHKIPRYRFYPQKSIALFTRVFLLKAI